MRGKKTLQKNADLGLNEMLNKLLVGVLVQADEHVQGGGAVGYELAVDLLGEDEVEEELEEPAELLIDGTIPHQVPHHVAAQHLHNTIQGNFLNINTLHNNLVPSVPEPVRFLPAPVFLADSGSNINEKNLQQRLRLNFIKNFEPHPTLLIRKRLFILQYR